eukprot:SAG22_NODE_6753_length_815_cov_2.308659_2_plen_64_part_00
MSAFVVFEDDESYENAMRWEAIAKYRHPKEDGGYGTREYLAEGFEPGPDTSQVHLIPAEEPGE